MFKIEEIKELIKLIDESSVERFEIEQEAAKLVIVKKGAAAAQPEQISKPIVAGVQEKPSVTSLEPLHKVLSPVVGVYYAAAEPGAQPFVRLGEKVTADKVVCIVEVMKLFNEVEAEVKGEIVDILVKDGDFVEYGQPLFVIRPE